jgi:hypothetical protein
MYLGLPDPHLDPLGRGTDPDPYQNVTDPKNTYQYDLELRQFG